MEVTPLHNPFVFLGLSETPLGFSGVDWHSFWDSLGLPVVLPGTPCSNHWGCVELSGTFCVTLWDPLTLSETGWDRLGHSGTVWVTELTE